MKKDIRKLFCLILVTAALVLSANHKASATAQQPDGLTVSPAFQMVTVPVGASQQPVSFKITNNRPVAQSFSLSVADFNALNESGGLFFVGTNPTSLQKKYGLAKWISLPQASISLQPKQTMTINATILNLPDLNPGGHYGALMIALGGQNQPGSIAIHPIASSLLFVTKLGGDTHRMSLKSVSFDSRLFKLPSKMTLRFHNDGNTHLVPRGSVSIFNPNGKLISKGIINENSGILLPEVDRDYSVSLHKVAISNLPGKYKIKVDFRFDGLNQYRSYQKTFFYISGPLVSLFLIAAISAFVILIWLYKNKIGTKQAR